MYWRLQRECDEFGRHGRVSPKVRESTQPPISPWCAERGGVDEKRQRTHLGPNSISLVRSLKGSACPTSSHAQQAAQGVLVGLQSFILGGAVWTHGEIVVPESETRLENIKQGKGKFL